MKPSRRRDASARLNLAVSVQQASLAASQRAEHSACSQPLSWEQELHRGTGCLWWQRGKGQSSKLGEERGLPGGIWARRKTEGEQGAGRPHSSSGSLCLFSPQNWWEKSITCHLLRAMLLVLPFSLRPDKISFWVPPGTATVKGKELLGCLQTAWSQKMSEGKKDGML